MVRRRYLPKNTASCTRELVGLGLGMKSQQTTLMNANDPPVLAEFFWVNSELPDAELRSFSLS